MVAHARTIAVALVATAALLLLFHKGRSAERLETAEVRQLDKDRPLPRVNEQGESIGSGANEDESADQYPSESRTGIPALEKHERLQSHVSSQKGDSVDVIFLGDSITERWTREGEGGGSAAWSRLLQEVGSNIKAVNLGVGGDQVRHVRWRVQNGELPPSLDVKVMVLMVGINDILSGVNRKTVLNELKGLVNLLRQLKPGAKLIVVGLIPESYKFPSSPAKVNADLLPWLETQHIQAVDCSNYFYENNRNLKSELYIQDPWPLLHLSSEGYEVFANCLANLIKEALVEN